MQEREKPKTRTDRVLNKLKDHSVFAVLFAAGTLFAALTAVVDPIINWRESFSPISAPALTATVEFSGECNSDFWRPPLPIEVASIKPDPSSRAARRWARLKVTINNQDARPRVLTSAILEPMWITYVATLGLAEVTHETDVSLQIWAKIGSEVAFSLMSRDPRPKAGARGSTKYSVIAADGSHAIRDTVDYVISEPAWPWFRPDPFDVSDSLRGQYVAEPASAEQVAFSLGGVGPNEFLAGTFRARMVFDDGSESMSNVVWFELCPSKT